MNNTNKTLVEEKSKSWEMFNQISPKYDCVNRLMTFGMDLTWRKKLTEFLPLKHSVELLDLACGTADVPIILVKSTDAIGHAIGVDLAEDMIRLGRRKISKEKLDHKIVLLKEDAQDLSFEDESFDVVTMAFGIRNVPDVPKTLYEIHRVLRPNGRILILESSIPKNEAIRSIHLFYLKHIVPFVGGIVTGNRQAYRYLNQTVEAFPSGEAFNKILTDCKFRKVHDVPLLMGASSIYIGTK